MSEHLPPDPRSVIPVVRRCARRVGCALGVVLALGGVPGTRLDTERLPPPVAVEHLGDAEVEVTVVDGPDGLAIAGARVRVLPTSEDGVFSTDSRETDATGQVSISGLPRGEAWVFADALGRARGSTHLVLGSEPRSVTIALAPEHAIDVGVRDDLGAPLPEAQVEVASASDPLPVGARPGTDGTAHVGRLDAGPWRVTARAPGYDDAGARASHDGEVVTLVLHKLGAIRVRAIAADASVAADARIAVAGATLWPPRTARTDAHGEVRIGGLKSGTYALKASRGDLVSTTELGVVLARGEEKSVTLQLLPGRFVGVLVTDGDASDADPIAGARLSLAEGGISPFPLEATTDTKGRARLGPVAPGAATLGARAPGFVARGAVAVPDPSPPETRVALVRAGALTGRVVDARGYPVDGATIEIAGTDAAGGPIYDDPRRASFQAAHFDAMLAGFAPLLPAGDLGVMAGPVPQIPHGPGAPPGPPSLAGAAQAAEPWVTQSDGTFTASPATPGRVRAIVRHPQYVEAESAVVTLPPAGQAHVEVVMHEGGTLEGRVFDASDQPVRAARVLVAATRGSLERLTHTASDGSFALAALPGSISLTAGADEDPEAVRMTLAIPEAGRREVTIRLPAPRAPLPVTVVDDGGWPVDAAQITASSITPDSPLRTTAFTDANGEATIKRARGLPLRVEVRAPRRAPRVVTTEASIDSLRVELAAGETATGEVVAARGRDAIPDAEVVLYSDIGVRRTRTDLRGTFSLADLAPGTARLTVHKSGFSPATQSITVPDRGGLSAYAIRRVELVAEGVVEGQVVDARGDPVAGARVAAGHVPTWLLVGASPDGVAVTDARGRFRLGELAAGALDVEAYAPDLGRARVAGVKVEAGRATEDVRVVLAPESADAGAPGELGASGGVAVTLGETGAPTEVVIVSVVGGSEAERAGLAPGDVLLSVDGVAVRTMAEARGKLSGPLGDDVVTGVRRGDADLSLRVQREPVRR
ncbi:MAG TPA: carboxypeptidase regulatory-like domain-containing protein [Polyangiaceae bacterium]|nr:carboxypeptidase regulatory-like domain-containing protein [Polyangiaceae bacterium]